MKDMREIFLDGINKINRIGKRKAPPPYGGYKNYANTNNFALRAGGGDV